MQNEMNDPSAGLAFDEPENVFIIAAELINMKCESVEILLDNLVLKMI